MTTIEETSVTDTFTAVETPTRLHRLTVVAVVGGVWLMTAQAWGLFAPLGFPPIAGTDDVGRVLGIAMAVAITVIAWRLAPRSGALRVRIDRDGIDWRGPGRRHVRWSAIERIGEQSLRGMVKVAGDMAGTREGPMSVWLKPEARRGLTAAGNRRLGYGDINLTTLGTDRSRSELRDALARFAPEGVMPSARADSVMAQMR